MIKGVDFGLKCPDYGKEKNMFKLNNQLDIDEDKCVDFVHMLMCFQANVSLDMFYPNNKRLRDWICAVQGHKHGLK